MQFKNFLIPGSIVIASMVVGLSIYTSGGIQITQTQVAGQAIEGQAVAELPLKREVGAHVLGNPDAPITIVEFSDPYCHFCNVIHPTLQQLVDESEGQIKWEYRHLPMVGGQRAVVAAIASECVAELAGEDAFWQFTNSMLSNQSQLNEAFLAAEAVRLGIDSAAYTACLGDESKLAIIQNDFDTARALGASGTPFNVIEFADGSTQLIPGALPLEEWEAVIGGQTLRL